MTSLDVSLDLVSPFGGNPASDLADTPGPSATCGFRLAALASWREPTGLRSLGGATPARALRTLSIPGPAGRLEGLLNEGSPDAPFTALVCHPHPAGGGTMHNKVVYHAMKVMNGEQWGFRWPTLRFNFRGTGLSQGTHDGSAEAADVLAALTWLHSEFHRPIVVAGFSFGAFMALKACCAGNPSADVRALALLGLPTHIEGRPGAIEISYKFLSNCTLPKLFLSGDNDQFAPAADLEQVAASALEPKNLALIPGADHFFTGQIEPMQQALSRWLRGHFPIQPFHSSEQQP